MIPKVKTWQVKFWTTQDSRWRGRVLKARVQTINKRFAKMMANEILGYPAIFSNKVTVGLINRDNSWYNAPKKPLPLRAAINAYKALKEEK